MRLSLLGASGWIGSHLYKILCDVNNLTVDYVDRANIYEWIDSTIEPDIIVYLIGKTGNYRWQLVDTCYSHVSLLMKIMEAKITRRYVYASSVNVYDNAVSTSESALLSFRSEELNSVYILSKLLGESVLLNTPEINPLVLRISNVIGSYTPKHLFYGSLIDDCLRYGRAIINQPETYARDYVMVDELVLVITNLIQMECTGIINLASGVNTPNKVICKYLKSLGYSVYISCADNTGHRGKKSIEVGRLSKLGLRLNSPFS